MGLNLGVVADRPYAGRYVVVTTRVLGVSAAARRTSPRRMVELVDSARSNVFENTYLGIRLMRAA
jgi:hypothetical protein